MIWTESGSDFKKHLVGFWQHHHRHHLAEVDKPQAQKILACYRKLRRTSLGWYISRLAIWTKRKSMEDTFIMEIQTIHEFWIQQLYINFTECNGAGKSTQYHLSIGGKYGIQRKKDRSSLARQFNHQQDDGNLWSIRTPHWRSRLWSSFVFVRRAT